MNKNFLLLFFLCFNLINANAQELVNDSTATGENYMFDVYYELKTGEKTFIDRSNWDLAFQLIGLESAIHINSGNGMELFKTPYGVDDWANVDSAGLINLSNRLENSPETWTWGAFNQTGDSVIADLGWGVYDFSTHYITGDSLFIIKLADGSYKKILIEILKNGVYYFKYADLDGNNEVKAELKKSAFSNKFLGFYSFSQNQILDREPPLNSWDLVFTKYVNVFQGVPDPYKYYPVSGVFTNYKTRAAKVITMDPQNYTDTVGLMWSKDRNIIGYDWKAFDNQNMVYTISDTTAYFVLDQSNDVWRVVFTDFKGSQTGEYYWNKINLGSLSSLDHHEFVTNVILYPNPAGESATLLLQVDELLTSNSHLKVNIQDITGKTMRSYSVYLNNGFYGLEMNTSTLPSGQYVVQIVSDHQPTIYKKLLIR